MTCIVGLLDSGHAGHAIAVRSDGKVCKGVCASQVT
jgi:hypothetical protein